MGFNGILRHHAVRDLVHTWCQSAGLRPEREKFGLLLPTGPEDMNNSQARRPADVYLPAFAGSPTAFDFAITAPQRQETLAQASVRTAAAAEAYARHKELHLHTAQACEQQGVKFVPLVAECTGTWDPSALKVLKHVAHAAAAKTGEEPAVCYNQLLQELGTTIRSFRARAALRRRFEASWAWHLHWHYSGHPSRSRSQPSKIEFGLMPPTWIPMAITSEWALPVPSWGCCPLLFSQSGCSFFFVRKCRCWSFAAIVGNGSHASSHCSMVDAGSVFGSLAGLPHFPMSFTSISADFDPWPHDNF